MQTRFLLVSNPRTGSTMLRLALGSHPAVKFHVLYFGKSHQDWEQFQSEKQPAGTTHLGTQVYRSADNRWIEQHGPIRPVKFWPMLRDNHTRFVCLQRKNLLRQYLSREIAGNVPGKREVHRPRTMDPEPIGLRPQKLVGFVNSVLEARVTVDSAFPDRLIVTYEQLVTDWPDTLRRIQRYLGLSVQRLAATTYQQEARPLEAAIRNYGEVATCLSEHGWQDWLHD